MMTVITAAKAFKMGYDAAKAGEPKSSNPYRPEFAPNTSAAWARGWDDGNNWSGKAAEGAKP